MIKSPSASEYIRAAQERNYHKMDINDKSNVTPEGSNEINVEEILKSIRDEINEKGYTADILTFNDVLSTYTFPIENSSSTEELRGALVYLNSSYAVPESIPVQGNFFVRLIKRFIRKFLRFYVKPIVMTQNEFNANCVRALNNINSYIDNTSASNVTELENRISMLELKLSSTVKENERLSKRVAELEAAQKAG